MANLDEVRARFEQNPVVIPGFVPESTEASSPDQREFMDSFSGVSTTETPAISTEAQSQIDALEQRIENLQNAFVASGNPQVSRAETLALAGMANSIANSTRRERLSKGKIAAIATVGAVLGAGGMFLLLKDELNDYAAAANSCEFPQPNNGTPFIEDESSQSASASPTTVAVPPSNRNAVTNGSPGEVISPTIAGNLLLEGAAPAIQEFSDGSFVESQTTFQWKTLTVNESHDNYVIQLLQQAPAGFVADSRMQRYIAEGDYTKEELLQFLVVNNAVDPNVSSAFIKLVGSDSEQLTEIVVGSQL